MQLTKSIHSIICIATGDSVITAKMGGGRTGAGVRIRRGKPWIEKQKVSVNP